MVRTKVPMELIKDTKRRKSTLKKSGKTLMKKARELATLCDVPICVIIDSGPDSKPETYPENQGEVCSLINRYLSIPMEVRANPKRSVNLHDALQCNDCPNPTAVDEFAVDGFAVDGCPNPTAVNGFAVDGFSVDGFSVDGFSRKELSKLVSTLDLKLQQVAERIEFLNHSCGNHDQVGEFEAIPQGFMVTGVYHDDGNASLCQMGDDTFDPDVFSFIGSDFYCDDEVTLDQCFA